MLRPGVLTADSGGWHSVGNGHEALVRKWRMQKRTVVMRVWFKFADTIQEIRKIITERNWNGEVSWRKLQRLFIWRGLKSIVVSWLPFYSPPNNSQADSIDSYNPYSTPRTTAHSSYQYICIRSNPCSQPCPKFIRPISLRWQPFPFLQSPRGFNDHCPSITSELNNV